LNDYKLTVHGLLLYFIEGNGTIDYGFNAGCGIGYVEIISSVDGIINI
jgi:hypothetical protein